MKPQTTFAYDVLAAVVSSLNRYIYFQRKIQPRQKQLIFLKKKVEHENSLPIHFLHAPVTYRQRTR